MARARKPAKTLRSTKHRALCVLLIAARRKAGLNQTGLARLLHKPQSFVAKYEGGERRLDVVEFLTITKALQADPHKMLRHLTKIRA